MGCFINASIKSFQQNTKGQQGTILKKKKSSLSVDLKTAENRQNKKLWNFNNRFNENFKYST